jgi:deoxyribose-phosphate aldolase
LDNSKLSDSALRNRLKEFNEFFESFSPSDVSTDEKYIAGLIDHSLLKPEASPHEINKLCSEALEYKFASVCVNSSYVTQCYDILKDTDVKICSTAGFPLGASLPEVKHFEMECAINYGAREIDMVMNTGRLLSGEYDKLFNELRLISSSAHSGSAILKVIIETCLLSDINKAAACIICLEAGADFIKTSTGFNKSGAVPRDVALLKFIGGGKLPVKASGGIKTLNDLLKMVSYGAERIGTSSGVQIIESLRMKSKKV